MEGHPTFATLFEGLGAQLPLPTRVVIAASNGVVAWGWLVLVGIIGALGYAVNRYYTEGGRYADAIRSGRRPGDILRRSRSRASPDAVDAP